MYKRQVLDTGIVAVNGKESLISADTVVLAVGATPVNELVEKLRGKPYQVVTVGDAKAVRKVMAAVTEGFFAGLEIV